MKRVDQYINKIYAKVNGSAEEVAELKAEMREHLLESIAELQAQGKSEEESIEIALQRFGDERQISQGVLEMFRTHLKFAKVLLALTILFLALSLALMAGNAWQEYKLSTERNAMTSEMYGIVRNHASITPEMRDLLTQVAIAHDYRLQYVALYYDPKGESLNEFPATLSKADFLYPASAAPFPFTGSSGGSQDGWAIQYQANFIQNSPLLTYGMDLLTVYWVLFALWGAVHAYNEGRLRVVWIVLFVLFNALGLVLYYLPWKRWAYRVAHA